MLPPPAAPGHPPAGRGGHRQVHRDLDDLARRTAVRSADWDRAGLRWHRAPGGAW